MYLLFQSILMSLHSATFCRVVASLQLIDFQSFIAKKLAVGSVRRPPMEKLTYSWNPFTSHIEIQSNRFKAKRKIEFTPEMSFKINFICFTPHFRAHDKSCIILRNKAFTSVFCGRYRYKNDCTQRPQGSSIITHWNLNGVSAEITGKH